MFQFPGFASTPYGFRCRYRRSGGFPHSDIHGSKLVRSSPWLFAAYHVLHRLYAPRHSPNALKSLDCSHYQCSPHQSCSNDRLKEPTGLVISLTASLARAAIEAIDTLCSAQNKVSQKDQIILMRLICIRWVRSMIVLVVCPVLPNQKI